MDDAVTLLVLLAVSFGLYLAYRASKRAQGEPVRPRHAHRSGMPVDWSQGTFSVWGQVAQVPELFDTATVRLLGYPVLAAVVEQVMADHPAPVRAGAACGCQGGGVASASTEEAPKPVFFKPGEPERLADYEGQEHVTSYLQALIDSLDAQTVVPQEHQLFLGPPGMGKSLLARVFANSLMARNTSVGMPNIYFMEVFPADLPTLQALDTTIRRAADRPTILFIDEIHDLTDRHVLKLYGLMEDGRYKFEGEDEPVPIPNVLLIGATTDYGAMHPALKRRFNRHVLEPMTKAQIAAVVDGRPFPIRSDALAALVERTHFSGAPWEALQLYRQASAFAKARKAGAVESPDLERVFASQQLDALGLRALDRRVLGVLLQQPKYKNARGGGKEFVCYAASENDVVAMAQVDRGEYRESIKPRLMARGLLQVRATYGQALTPKAVQLYGWLGRGN